MLTSVWADEVQAVLDQAGRPGNRQVRVGNRTVRIPTPFPSPADWRDRWIYFLLIDRFDNPAAPPAAAPWDGVHDLFQGGTLEGVRQRLGYLAELGVGAIWLSPVLKNCQYLPGSYHGYGIQDFLRVDPRFASQPEHAEEELRALVDEAHARGMHVILDVVLNHAGDVFAYRCDGDPLCQQSGGAMASGRADGYTIEWRDQDGAPRADWTEAPADPPPDAAVHPLELRRNVLFRRQGVGGELGGDFESLKEFVTDYQERQPERGLYYPVRDTLIRAYQHAIARFDVDGFRIDTLKFVEPDFARIFGNAMREFALGIGKRNFFTFGEVWDSEERIARFIGRPAADPSDLIGVDAALDFPLLYRLPPVAKGLLAPSELAAMFEHRKAVQASILSSHGEASRYFVTFLDNHDQKARFYYQDPNDPARYDDQLTLAVACLFALQGVPCLYYGTEQGLHGAGDVDRAVREALWGKPSPFDRAHPFYRQIRRLAALRAAQPALRYGRQYFRPISGDGAHFGASPFSAGVLAFSRILNDREVVVVANTNTTQPWSGEVLVDYALNPPGAGHRVLYSNKPPSAVRPPGPVVEKPEGVEIHEVSGGVTTGPARAISVTLGPIEVQILGRS
jgi:glycosidase